MFEPPAAKKTWWGRNWMWAVPVGCLGACALPVACVAGLTALIMTGITQSGPYADAVEMVRSHDEAVELLGEPIETRFMTTGNISINGESGEADLTIPLRGKRRDGMLYVIAEKRAGRWEYHLVELEVDGRGERLDLLAEPAAAGSDGDEATSGDKDAAAVD